MKEKARMDDRQLPYLYDFFNVEARWAGQNAPSSVIARILNSTIELINELHAIPRLLVFLPDWDIVHDIHFHDFGISKIIGTNVEWLV